MNTLALTLVVLIAKEVQASPLVATGVVVISLAAIMLCVVWKTLVRSYAQLNRGKFTVIDCLENRLPAALFRAEWAVLGKGKDLKRYSPFTRTEAVVSNIFMVIHGLAAALAAAWLISSRL